jgi:hypothetical protein
MSGAVNQARCTSFEYKTGDETVTKEIRSFEAQVMDAEAIDKLKRMSSCFFSEARVTP